MYKRKYRSGTGTPSMLLLSSYVIQLLIFFIFIRNTSVLYRSDMWLFFLRIIQCVVCGCYKNHASKNPIGDICSGTARMFCSVLKFEAHLDIVALYYCLAWNIRTSICQNKHFISSLYLFFTCLYIYTLRWLPNPFHKSVPLFVKVMYIVCKFHVFRFPWCYPRLYLRLQHD